MDNTIILSIQYLYRNEYRLIIYPNDSPYVFNFITTKKLKDFAIEIAKDKSLALLNIRNEWKEIRKISEYKLKECNIKIEES
jgi:hypothetical protein